MHGLAMCVAVGVISTVLPQEAVGVAGMMGECLDSLTMVLMRVRSCDLICREVRGETRWVE